MSSSTTQTSSTTTDMTLSSVAKIIEIIGTSDKGWEDAAQVAINEARKTIHGIHGLEVQDMTASVDNTGRIVKYKTTVRIAFSVEH